MYWQKETEHVFQYNFSISNIGPGGLEREGGFRRERDRMTSDTA